MISPRIVLASASPRRRDLLAELGLPFTVAATDVDEDAIARAFAGDPLALASRLARAKLDAHPASVAEAVLAADTIVAIDGRILGKPRDAAEAGRMLRDLRGRRHTVVTAIALRVGPDVSSDVASARVVDAPLHGRGDSGVHRARRALRQSRRLRHPGCGLRARRGAGWLPLRCNRAAAVADGGADAARGPRRRRPACPGAAAIAPIGRLRPVGRLLAPDRGTGMRGPLAVIGGVPEAASGVSRIRASRRCPMITTGVGERPLHHCSRGGEATRQECLPVPQSTAAHTTATDATTTLAGSTEPSPKMRASFATAPSVSS